MERKKESKKERKKLKESNGLSFEACNAEYKQRKIAYDKS